MAPLLWIGAALGSLLLFGGKAGAQQTSGRTLAEGPPPSPPQPAPPAGYRRVNASDVITDEMLAAARAALANPIGTLLVHGGWAIQLEWHYHEPGGPTKPWGWHKGATIYIATDQHPTSVGEGI